MNIPDGYKQVTPYLILKNAFEFISYTQKVFDAEEKFKEMRNENVIMHAEIMIGDCVIMFADATEKYLPQPAGFFIYVEDADETFKKAVEDGGTVVNEIADQSYGRSGGVKDPFGNTWWITSVK